MITPTNLEIDDADLVASLSHSFKEMMGLMRPPLNPIRFLKDENAHGNQAWNAPPGIEGKGDASLELSRLRDVIPVLLEPAMNLTQAVFELHLGFVFEDLAGLVDRGQEARLLVPVPALLEDDSRRVAGEFVHPLGEVCDPNFAPRSEIDGFPDRLVIMGARKKATDDDAHIGEVSRLFARPRDREAFSVHRPVEEIGDHIPVLTWDLAGSIGIEEPRIHHGEIVEPMEHARVELAEHLRDLVGRVKLSRDVLLGEGHGGVRSIDATARGGVDETIHAHEVGVLEYFQRAHPVDHEVEFRMVNGVLIREMRGEVVDNFGTLLESLPQILIPRNVASEELDLRTLGDVPLVGGREVVEDYDALHVESGEGVHQVCADGARAAEDQHGRAVEGLGKVVHATRPT